MYNRIQYRIAYSLALSLFILLTLPNFANAQTEILLNGSAEANTVTTNGGTIDNWTEDNEEWAAEDPNNFSLGFAAQDGTNAFIPLSTDNSGDTKIWILSQTVDVSSDATAIDAGNVTIAFSGYLQCAIGSGDSGRIRVQFLNGSSSIIEEYDSGFINNESGSWQNLTDSRTAPNGTRSIKVVLEGDNAGDTGGGADDLFADAAFDNLSLTKTVSSSNTPPTTADADVFTVVNTEIAFSDTDFPYSDGDSDPLNAVDITTLPGSGTLYLDSSNDDTYDGGEEVTAGDDISLANLQNGHLRYIPPSSTTGYQAVSFTFSVGDGTDFSSASTMNITMDAISVEIGDNGDDGNDNWHLISNPTNSNLTDLLSNVWTQGSANAMYTGGTPNVYTYDEVAQDYTGVPDLGTSPSAGTGHLVLLYADDDYASGGIQGDWPKPLSVTGMHNTSTVSIAAQNTDDDGSTTLTNDEGWNLIGNPFGTNISVDAVISALETAFGSGEINSSVYIWDPDANSGDGGFVTRSSGAAIAAFQAFFVRLLTPGDSGNFDLDNSTRTSTAASILKEPEQNYPQLILAVNGSKISDQIRFHFTENGNLGIDRDDVFELSSLSSNYLQFFSLVGDQALAMNNLPNHLEEEISIPIYLKGTESGTFHLESTFESIPDQWHIQLENTKSGKTINLRETTEFHFDYTSNIQKKETVKPVLSMNKAEHNHLFNLVISPSESGINEEVPESFTLKQNYPNPFNPSTQIEYSLPEQSRVSIKIYDMMGRQIHTLLNEQMPAGTHQITWNGENRSSGIYIYRLEAANRILTRKMTLIK